MTGPSIEYDLAVATAHAANLFDRIEDGYVVFDCPGCRQAMRVDGRPGGTARFRCYSNCSDEGAIVDQFVLLADLLDVVAAGERVVRFRSPEEIRAAEPDEIDFVLDGYLARRAVTLLGGKPKSGKSTLGFAIAEAMVTGASSFLGRGLVAGPVVYVSEEDATTVRSKLPPNGTPLRVLTRGDAWPRPSWRALIDAAVAEAERVAAGLLVIDTLAFWSDLKADQEKDAGAAGETMEALVEAANAGLAVLLVHHQRKSGGEEGDAFRGSSAITGAVEALVELERVPDAPPGQRRLIATARWSAPGMLLLDRDAATGAWRVIGEGAGREDAATLGIRERILQAVPGEQPGATEPELADLVELDRRKLGRPLRELVEEGLVRRVGEGKPYQPYRYFEAPAETLPRTLPADGGESALPTLPVPVGGRGERRDLPLPGGESRPAARRPRRRRESLRTTS